MLDLVRLTVFETLRRLALRIEARDPGQPVLRFERETGGRFREGIGRDGRERRPPGDLTDRRR